jgi:hypothetical protein
MKKTGQSFYFVGPTGLLLPPLGVCDLVTRAFTLAL